jgi:hypothetical protein
VTEKAKKVKEEEAIFFEWLQIGKANGWISESYCDIHDGIVMTDREMEIWPEEDGCMYAVRLYGV